MVRIVDMGDIARVLSRIFRYARVPLLSLDEAVSLTIDAVSLMVDMYITGREMDLSGSQYSVVDANKWVCPRGERWELMDVAMGATIGTQSGVHITCRGSTLWVFSESTARRSLDVSGYVLNEGDWIGVANTGNGSDTAATCYMSARRLRLVN